MVAMGLMRSLHAQVMVEGTDLVIGFGGDCLAKHTKKEKRHYPTTKAADADPDGAFERAYAETAGVPPDANDLHGSMHEEGVPLQASQAGDDADSQLSDWECALFGMESHTIRPKKGEVPNWFWRWMQFIAFGNRWRRRRKDTD